MWGEETTAKPERSVAWLRISVDDAGEHVLGCMLETGIGSGDPLGYVLAVSRLPPSGEGAAKPTACAPMRGLTDRLLLEVSGNAALVVALESEFERAGLAEEFRADLPVCLLASGEGDPFDAPVDEFSHRLEWHSLASERALEARQGLEETMARTRPLEPLERAERGLHEALADPRVGSLARSDGLVTAVSLSARRWPRYHRENNVRKAACADSGPSDLAGRLWNILAAPAPSSLEENELRLEWPIPLMPFQRDGVQAMLKMNRLLLADDMGLGKTIQTLAALRILQARGDIRTALVVAPAGVLTQWRREIENWSPELSAIVVRGSADEREWQWSADRDVFLTSYDVLRNDRIPGPRGRQGVWDVVVLDEAQRIKNRNDTSDAAKRISRVRSWALTGTPVENREDELASIMEFVDHNDDAGFRFQRYQPGPALRRRHRELQIRRKKNDVLKDLPEKLETRLEIALDPEQRKSYEKAEREGIVYLRSLGTNVHIQHVLELITRLKQICNADPETGVSCKLRDIRERLRELAARGHKALVFSQYASDSSGVGAAARYLREFNPAVLTGSTPPDERTELIDRFRKADSQRAMIISLRAGGVGLNLQEASYVFHLDRWWNPAMEKQAEDRSHRIGQTVKVNVFKYTCVDTIEERIEQILRQKDLLFRELVDDVSLDISTALSSKDMFGLFGLDAD